MDSHSETDAVPSLSEAGTSNPLAEGVVVINDVHIQDFLAQSGLDASSIDPASLEALKELLGSSAHSKNNDIDPLDRNDSKHAKSDFATTTTTTASSSNGSNGLQLQRELARAEELVNATVVEKRILNQLEQQLGLLMGMQRQLETLSEKVQHLEQAIANPKNNNINAAPIRHRQEQWPMMAPRPVQHDVQHPPQMNQIHPEVAPRRPPPAAAIWFNPRNVFSSIFGMLYESRLSKIIRLFWRMQQQQVQNFDGGLMLKLLVIVAILTARWSSNKRKKQASSNNNGAGVNPTPSLAQFWEAYRLYIMTMLVGVGFLIQSGYLQFLYNFFIKENYPVRIWCGEDVDTEAQGQQQQGGPLREQQQMNRQQQPEAQGVQQQRQPQARGGVQDVGGNNGGVNRFLDWNQIWGEGVLRVMVGPPPQEQANHSFLVQVGRMVVKTSVDFVCLIGSFVLSIFPMVNLEELRIPVAQLNDDDNAQPLHHRGEAAAARAQEDRIEPAPGQLQPPRDPAEPLDE